MKHRITMAIICLHISAVLYILLALAIISFDAAAGDEVQLPGFGVALAILCVALNS